MTGWRRTGERIGEWIGAEATGSIIDLYVGLLYYLIHRGGSLERRAGKRCPIISLIEVKIWSGEKSTKIGQITNFS